jgi:hypothetical protein
MSYDGPAAVAALEIVWRHGGRPLSDLIRTAQRDLMQASDEADQ